MFVPKGLNTAGIMTNNIISKKCQLGQLVCNDGNISILYTNNVFVNGFLKIDGNLDMNGDIISNGDLSVLGNVGILGNLDVSGNVNFKDDLSVLGNVGVLGNLDVSGNVNISEDLTVLGVTTSSAYNISDYRIKENVELLDSSYVIDELKPIKYLNKLNNNIEIGFTAHEVKEVYSYLVKGEKDAKEYQSVNYIGIIGILVNEIKNLKSRLEILESDN